MSDFSPISYQDALEVILTAVHTLPVEAVPLDEVLGRALGESLFANLDLPHFDNAAMDGYAIRAADTIDAAPGHPVRLQLIGRVSAGAADLPTLEAGTAIGISTGARIPPGADAVARSEIAHRVGELVSIEAPVEFGRDIRIVGEDVRRDTQVLYAGQDLRPAEIGLLAALGRASIPVYQRPRVAVLTTGDELASPGEKLSPGQQYNANRPALAAQVVEAGGLPTPLAAASDDPDTTAEQVKAGLAYDALVVSAGVSVGERDYVRPALNRFGHISAWRLEMRPVRPFAFGRIGQTLVFALPGNPVASLLGFELLVRPALRLLGGHQRIGRPELTAALELPVENQGGLLTFARGVLSHGPEATVRLAGPQGTANLATLAGANCLIVVPSEVEQLDAGSLVRVRLLDGNA